MSEYVVTRPFSGSPAVGEPVIIPDARRADALMRQRHVEPLERAATGSFQGLVLQAISLIGTKALPAFLANIDDANLLNTALVSEERDTAAVAIQARINQLEEAN